MEALAKPALVVPCVEGGTAEWGSPAPTVLECILLRRGACFFRCQRLLLARTPSPSNRYFNHNLPPHPSSHILKIISTTTTTTNLLLSSSSFFVVVVLFCQFE